MITINGLEPTFTTFPDQEINVSFQPTLIKTLSENIVVNWKFEATEEVFKLGLVLDLINTYLEKRNQIIHVVIPFLPYSRMDRHEPGYHNPLSINVLQNILKAYKKSSINPVEFTTIDVHNVQALDNTLIKNVDIMPSRIQDWLIDNNLRAEETLLVFPDKGSLARYLTPKMSNILLANNAFEIAVGNKHRDFETHKITSYELEGYYDQVYDLSKVKQALIIDDVISYGGTFIKLTQSLHELGITDVTLLTSHAEDALWRGDLLDPNLNVKIITSSSLNHHISDDRVTIKELV